MCDQLIRDLSKHLEETEETSDNRTRDFLERSLLELKKLRERDIYHKVFRFNVDIKEIPVPSEPALPDDEYHRWFLAALEEEIYKEFLGHGGLVAKVDAIVDLIYFALGYFVRAGVDFNHAFNEVHAANMRKIRGSLEKRGNYGHDAVKPPGWIGPDYSWLDPYDS